MSVINTGTHPKLLWPGILAIWGQTYAEHAKEYPDLFSIMTSEKAYEEMLQLTGFGLASIKPESQAGSYDTEVQGYVTRAIHLAYSLGYKVTYEELKDNLYEEVSRNRATANAFSMRQTIETVAAFIYNNAFNSTFFTTGDGVALLSASHVRTTGGTYSNLLTPGADLSEPALEDLLIQIMQAENDRGLKIALMARSLHVSPSEHFNAYRILKSAGQPDTQSNNVNVLKATGAFPEGVKLNHYFSAPNSWFVRTNCPQGMTMFMREEPNLSMDNDFDTKNAKALAYMRFSLTCGDPRGIYGSPGNA
jgi:hypothetical protein